MPRGTQAEAKPLFDNPCVGELSVTWNAKLSQWIMLYNCNNPSGVVARVAANPGGPWSGPAVLFDAAADAGTRYFIHGTADCGPASDPFTPGGGPGGVYAPLIIPRYTRNGPGSSTTIYYTMSTWNPYQVTLMKSTLSVP